MKPNIFLESERIYLRALKEEDADGNYKYWLNDKEICIGNSHHRFPMTEVKLKKYIVESNNSSGMLVMGIFDKMTESHIGNVSLQNINYISRSAEFAIIIGERDFWNKGIGKEVGILMIDHGLNVLNLNRIYCGTYCTNHGMQKLAISLGFKQEGLRREADFKDGEYVDVVEFGLLKCEWKLK